MKSPRLSSAGKGSLREFPAATPVPGPMPQSAYPAAADPTSNTLPLWPQPATLPPLERRVVHVWRLRLSTALAEQTPRADCLAADELARARAFRFEPDRRHFLRRRALLRQVLAAHLGVAPAAVRFIANEHCKPALVGAAGAHPLRFSYCHSADLALLAVTCDRDVGVDLELHRPLPDARQIAASFFAPIEVAALQRVPQAEWESAFFDCWTRKEAFSKALGLGLLLPLNAFAVALGEPARLLELHGAPPPPDAWTLRSLPVGRGFSAALAVEGSKPTVCCWDWH
jgi:4'-phosphopantetheinyl transferase